jgi:hypothetical protein
VQAGIIALRSLLLRTFRVGENATATCFQETGCFTPGVPDGGKSSGFLNFFKKFLRVTAAGQHIAAKLLSVITPLHQSAHEYS